MTTEQLGNTANIVHGTADATVKYGTGNISFSVLVVIACLMMLVFMALIAVVIASGRKSSDRLQVLQDKIMEETKTTVETVTMFHSEIMEMRKDICENNKAILEALKVLKEDDKVLVKKTIETLEEISKNISDRNFMSDGDFYDAVCDRYYHVTTEIERFCLDIVKRNDIKNRIDSIMTDIKTHVDIIIRESQTMMLKKHYYEDVKLELIDYTNSQKEQGTKDVIQAFIDYIDVEGFARKIKDQEDLERKIKSLSKHFYQDSTQRLAEIITERQMKIKVLH